MKIAFFADTFYPNLGGVEDATALLAKTLGEGGHQIEIFVPRFSARDFYLRHLPVREIDLGEKVRVHRLFSLPLLGSIPGRLVVPLGLAYFRLRSDPPDIIHTQTIFGAGIEALLASYFLKVPMVGTNHSIVSEFRGYVPKSLRFIFSYISRYDVWYYNHCRLVTAPSETVLIEMRKYGLKSESRSLSNLIDTKTFQPLGLDDDKEELKKEFGLAKHQVVTYAGRFALEKRVEVILRAISLVKRKFPLITLALAGQGPEEAKWRQIIKSLGLEHNVNFMGVLSKPRLAKLFQATDVFAIASPAETQSLVTLQAMACGLPVVGVNARALPEYIKDGVTGYIVPVDDHTKMAEVLIDLLTDGRICQMFEKNSRQTAERFSARKMAKEWEETYQRAIENNL